MPVAWGFDALDVPPAAVSSNDNVVLLYLTTFFMLARSCHRRPISNLCILVLSALAVWGLHRHAAVSLDPRFPSPFSPVPSAQCPRPSLASPRLARSRPRRYISRAVLP